jgi:hypothetical protein
MSALRNYTQCLGKPTFCSGLDNVDRMALTTTIGIGLYLFKKAVNVLGTTQTDKIQATSFNPLPENPSTIPTSAQVLASTSNSLKNGCQGSDQNSTNTGFKVVEATDRSFTR